MIQGPQWSRASLHLRAHNVKTPAHTQGQTDGKAP